MTTKINNISGLTTFSTTPTNLNAGVTTNSTIGATTNFVKNVLNAIIPLNTTSTISATLAFTSNIVVDVVKCVSNFSISGATIVFGRVGTTFNMLGINPFVGNFKYFVSGIGNSVRAVQSGSITGANQTVIFPNTQTGTTLVIVTAQTATTTGTNGYTTTGFTITNTGAVSTTTNWLSFGT
jgi:hypothetical protein